MTVPALPQAVPVGAGVIPAPADAPDRLHAVVADCPIDLVEKRSLAGVGWMGAGQVIRQLVQLGLFVALAHLLDPVAFGVMALVVVVTGFAAVIGEMGMEAALVQRPAVGQVDLSSAFWLLLVCNVGLALVLTTGSAQIASLLHAPGLQPVLGVASLVFPLTALSVVPRAVCARVLRFGPVALAETCSVVAGGTAAVVLAIGGAGVWALVVQQVVTAAVAAVLLGVAARWRPSLVCSRRSITDFWRFARGVVGFNSVNYWTRNADNLLIGRVLGATALGLYERAYMVLLLPVTQVAQVLGRVMLSSLSRIGDDLVRARALYLRTIALIALVVTPLMWLATVLAEPLVRAVFGDAWVGVVVPMQVLTAVGPLQAVATTVGWIYQARGRSDLYFRFGLAAAVAIVTAIVIGISFGSIEAVAISYAAMSVGVLFVPTIAIPGRLIGVRIRDVFGAIAAPLVAGAGMVLAVLAVDRLVLTGTGSWTRLICGSALGLLTYFALLSRLDSAALSDVLTVLRSRSSRRSASAPAS